MQKYGLAWVGLHPAPQRSLITPDASFDQYLRGDEQAITEKSRRGHVLFKSFCCVGCHQGINVGGNM